MARNDFLKRCSEEILSTQVPGRIGRIGDDGSSSPMPTDIARGIAITTPH
jgi:hypothetical protein